MKREAFKWVEYIFCAILVSVFSLQTYVTFQKSEEDFFYPSKTIANNFCKDFITNYSSRFDDVKAILTTPTRLNYIGEENESFATGATNYVLTQYYMAPNIVFKDMRADTILYNLYSTVHLDYASNFYLHNGWHLVKDFNNGLILLAK